MSRVYEVASVGELAAKGLVHPRPEPTWPETRVLMASADGAVWAAFIDADHSYEGCLRDIDAWLPKIARGGILAGHDIPHPPVEQAVRARFGDAFERRGSCWIVRRS